MSIVFFTPLHQVVTLDDDLVATRARGNQVNTLGSRKCDKEGDLADVLADALFIVVMSVRFRRRGDGQERSAITTVERLLTQADLSTVSSLIVIGDRGYGRDSLVDLLRSWGISTVMIMLSHLSKLHPLIPASLLWPGRDDEMHDFAMNEEDQQRDDSADHAECTEISQVALGKSEANSSCRMMALRGLPRCMLIETTRLVQHVFYTLIPIVFQAHISSATYSGSIRTSLSHGRSPHPGE